MHLQNPLLVFLHPPQMSIAATKVTSLQAALKQNNSSNTTNQLRFWSAFEQHSYFWDNTLILLQNAQTDLIFTPLLCLLVRKIYNHWRAINPSIRSKIKIQIVQKINFLALKQHGQILTDIQKSILTKLDSVLVEIIKCQWNSEWQSFLTDICSSCQQIPKASLNSLRILRMIFEDLLIDNSKKMTTYEIVEIKRQLQKNTVFILRLLESIAQSPQATANDHIECLKLLLILVKWFPIYYLLMSNIFNYIENKISQQNSQIRILAFNCLEEFLQAMLQKSFSSVQQKEKQFRNKLFQKMFAIFKRIETVQLQNNTKEVYIVVLHKFLQLNELWLLDNDENADMNIHQLMLVSLPKITKWTNLEQKPRIFSILLIFEKVNQKRHNLLAKMKDLLDIIIKWTILTIPKPIQDKYYLQQNGDIAQEDIDQIQQCAVDTATQLLKQLSYNHKSELNRNLIQLLTCIFINPFKIACTFDQLKSLGQAIRIKCFKLNQYQQDKQLLSDFIDYLLRLQGGIRKQQNSKSKVISLMLIDSILLHFFQDQGLYRKMDSQELKMAIFENVNKTMRESKNDNWDLIIFQSFRNMCRNIPAYILDVLDMFVQAFINKGISFTCNKNDKGYLFYEGLQICFTKTIQQDTTFQSLEKSEKIVTKLINPLIIEFQKLMKQNRQILKTKTPILQTSMNIIWVINQTCMHNSLLLTEVINKHSKTLDKIQQIFLYYSKELAQNMDQLMPNNPEKQTFLNLIDQFRKIYITYLTLWISTLNQIKIGDKQQIQISNLLLRDYEATPDIMKQALTIDYFNKFLNIVSEFKIIEQLAPRMVGIIEKIIQITEELIANDTFSYQQIRQSFFKFLITISDNYLIVCCSEYLHEQKQSIMNKFVSEVAVLISLLKYSRWAMQHKQQNFVELGKKMMERVLKICIENSSIQRIFVQKYLLGYSQSLFCMLITGSEEHFDQAIQALFYLLKTVQYKLNKIHMIPEQTVSNFQVIHNTILSKIQAIFPYKKNIKHKQHLQQIFVETIEAKFKTVFRDYRVLLYREEFHQLIC